MGFNATLGNISVISWRSVLWGEETGVPEENYRSVASHWQTWSHYVVSRTPASPWTGFELTTLVVKGSDYTGSCKSNWSRPRRPLFFCEECSYHQHDRTKRKKRDWEKGQNNGKNIPSIINHICILGMLVKSKYFGLNFYSRTPSRVSSFLYTNCIFRREKYFICFVINVKYIIAW